ncbi:peptidoglycan DD-metalloendopeptidase family protein [Propylenella binzhouense]|uniref:LysM peptidoglycan-binding domain-containing protein n=1 Tax=Propylenella binzhouense TaxID=2555902 RepID=A0A964T353_9HYPH|nr:M23 family metallopeptidase [Propylenella binzhouense]MYZ47365.1 LysM peptidoglycan-binding domain-containing protein [Propylenella binzhouense]
MSNLPTATSRSARARLLGRLSAVALLSGLGAACSANAIRLSEPIFTGSTPNQQQILAQQSDAYTPPAYAAPSAGPVYSSAPSGTVYSQNLPPPAGGQGSTPYASAGGYGGQSGTAPSYAAPAPQQAVASAPKPYTPPKPYAASGLPEPVGRVEQVAAPPAPAPAPVPHTTDMAAQAAPREPVPRGTPPTTLAAQARALQVPQTASAGAGAYTVQSGDSLWGIARQHGVTVSELSAANGLSGAPLKVGQTLAIPRAGSSAAGVQVASADPRMIPAEAQPRIGAPAPAPVQASGSQPLQPAPHTQQAALTPQAPSPQAATAAQPEASNPGFRWPVRGRIIAGFGKRPNGERNEGINLAVPEGTSVKAAEDGEVIYAGDELKSYGKLVLVRHSNGYVTAYAHNKELKVKKGEAVRRGEIIALSGMSGSVTTPQLHFELRKGATPIDPVSQLSDL